MIVPRDPVGGLVAHFDLASSAPGRDLASRWAGLRAEGRLRFTPWGVAFNDGGALSSEGYTGPRLTTFSLAVWVRHDGGNRNTLGSPVWLEALHTEAEDEARRQAERSGVAQPPWGEGLEFRSFAGPYAFIRAADHVRSSGLDASVDVDDEQWGGHRLFVVTYDGSRTRTFLYPFSYVADFTGSVPIRAFEPGKTKLWIGPLGESAGSGDLTGITVAELRIYDRVLTMDDVETLRSDFNHRRRLRARTVAAAMPRFSALHVLKDDGVYSEGVWVGRWQCVRVTPLDTGQVCLSFIEEQDGRVYFPHLSVGREGQLVAGSPTDVLYHERFHVVQAPSGRLILVSDNWKFLLSTTQGSGETESKLVLSTVPFDLYEWPELQVWGTAAGVKAAVDFLAPNSSAMLPLGWFASARRKDSALIPDGPVAAVVDGAGLVDGAFTRPLPAERIPPAGITLLVWVRVEPGAPIGSVAPRRVCQVTLGSGGGFVVVLNLEGRAGASGPEHCFSVYTDHQTSPLRPITPVDGTMQLVAIWVDVENQLLGARCGASAPDSVVPLPTADVSALTKPDLTGGRLDFQAASGRWTLAAVEVHAGRLLDTDLGLRDIVMRSRVSDRQMASKDRVPQTFALYSPLTGRFLSVQAAGGAVTTSTSLRQAAVWQKVDWFGNSPDLFIQLLDRQMWLAPTPASEASGGLPRAPAESEMIRVMVLPSGSLAFQDMQMVWLRAPDTPGPARVSRERYFPPVLGAEHEWIARPVPTVGQYVSTTDPPTLPPVFALYSQTAQGFLSVRSQFDMADDLEHPLYDSGPTWWKVDRSPLVAAAEANAVYLRDTETGKWLAANEGAWVLVDDPVGLAPVLWSTLPDGTFTFRDPASGDYIGQYLTIGAKNPFATLEHRWLVKVVQ